MIARSAMVVGALHRFVIGVLASLLLVCSSWAAEAGPAVDTPEARLHAAERLFEVPLYRQLATRQLYDTLSTLPDAQQQRATEALRDPAVVQAVRGVIVRSMAQTYSVKELQVLARVLAADEAHILVDKTDAFRAALMRELLSAAVTDPALGALLMPQ